MNRALLLVVGSALLTGSAPVMGSWASHEERGLAPQRDVLRWAYREWAVLGPSEQAAYLSGFLAGAAVVEAEELAASDPLSVAIARLQKERRLEFRLRPNVYSVRMAEYYFWENHRGERIAAALSAINNALSNP